MASGVSSSPDSLAQVAEQMKLVCHVLLGLKWREVEWV